MSVKINSVFASLPEEIKRIIYDYYDSKWYLYKYNPLRHSVLKKLCNNLRLFVPYWYRKNAPITSILCLDQKDFEHVKQKHSITGKSGEIIVSSECDNCEQTKSSRLILMYIKPDALVNYGGLYCDTCVDLQNRSSLN